MAMATKTRPPRGRRTSYSFQLGLTAHGLVFEGQRRRSRDSCCTVGGLATRAERPRFDLRKKGRVTTLATSTGAPSRPVRVTLLLDSLNAAGEEKGRGQPASGM
jgi:hypothetical protein